MLQFPVNIYPNSQAVDGVSENTFTFVFRGDILSKYQIKIYLNSNGSLVYTGTQVISVNYNGDIVQAIIPQNSFTNGNDYVWTITLWDGTGATVTSPNYFFKARRVPTVTMSNIPSPYPSRKIVLSGDYIQEQNVPIRNHIWTLFDSNNNIIDTTGKVYSSKLEYSFDGLLTGEVYFCSLVITNQDGVSISTGNLPIAVEYSTPDVTAPPMLEFIEDLNAVKVSWVENKQSIGSASGDINYLGDFPFVGGDSIRIGSGSIEYDKIANAPMSINNYAFSAIVSTNITNDKQGKIIELSDVIGGSYYVNLEGFRFYFYKGKNDVSFSDLQNYQLYDFEGSSLDAVSNGWLKTFIASIFSILKSGQTATGIPEAQVGYVWDDTDVWTDAKYWTDNVDFSKQFLVVLKPEEVLIEEIVI